MDKSDLVDIVIQEITEMALSVRRENCSYEERKIYSEIGKLSTHKEEVISKLPIEDRQIVEKYIEKINYIADQECKYLYVQGAKDCVCLLKKLGII